MLMNIAQDLIQRAHFFANEFFCNHSNFSAIRDRFDADVMVANTLYNQVIGSRA